MSENQTLTAQQIADNLGGRVVGDPGTVVSAVEIIEVRQQTTSRLSVTLRTYHD
jgi:hypothetical protein